MACFLLHFVLLIAGPSKLPPGTLDSLLVTLPYFTGPGGLLLGLLFLLRVLDWVPRELLGDGSVDPSGGQGPTPRPPAVAGRPRTASGGQGIRPAEDREGNGEAGG
jgi:hypothetical protein